MDILSPFISVLCHSDWHFHGESCPRLDVVHPGRAWPSSPACTWHCSLHYLFSRQLPFFLMLWPQYASFLALTVSNSCLFTPALLRTHSFVFFAVHKTRRIFLSHAPIACPLFNLIQNSVVHSPSSVIRDQRYGNVSTCFSSSFWMSMQYASSLAITLVLSTLYLQLTLSRRSTNPVAACCLVPLR